LTKNNFWAKINSGIYSHSGILPGNPAVLRGISGIPVGYLSEYCPNEGVLSSFRCGFSPKLVPFNYKMILHREVVLPFSFQIIKEYWFACTGFMYQICFNNPVFIYYRVGFSCFKRADKRDRTTRSNQQVWKKKRILLYNKYVSH